jgi:hypothetical protein
VVAAFDNQREFQRCLRAVSADIHRRRTAGEPIDAKEYASGITREAGDDQRAANGRLVTRAIRHGVSPGSRVERLAMPSNIAILRMEHGRPRWRQRVRRLFPPLRRRADQP